MISLLLTVRVPINNLFPISATKLNFTEKSNQTFARSLQYKIVYRTAYIIFLYKTRVIVTTVSFSLSVRS